MPYVLSNVDKKNIKWFSNDNTRQSLTKIGLNKGNMRGLSPFSLTLKYPITSIAGANGSGKSTLLAIASCAFHNKKSGYHLPGRNHTYYTFSDFFIQSAGELGPEGVEIGYSIRHDKWRNLDPGEEQQFRTKSKGGKWNNYDTRVNRNTIYLGIQRVVPYYERTTHKSYRTYFKSGKMLPEIRKRIAKLASKILEKTYSDFDTLEHSKYSLPKVEVNGLQYSGFNMGAGESTILEILSVIFAAGTGCLLIIDEIELGLHERAQVRLIEVLKELCFELKCQVICTTHAYEILAALPPEGRVYIEPLAGKTQIFPGISAEYACGKMGRSAPQELDIFVEDEVAQAIVHASLGHELRTRCQVMEIGSHGSLKRLMAARYMEGRKNCICLLDGDQRTSTESIKSDIAKMCDGKFTAQGEQIRNWVTGHLDFMPGAEWPEKWIFEQAIKCCDDPLDGWARSPAQDWGLASNDVLRNLLIQGLAADKHNEFPTLANALSLPEENVRRDLIAALRLSHTSEFDALSDRVRVLLG